MDLHFHTKQENLIYRDGQTYYNKKKISASSCITMNKVLIQLHGEKALDRINEISQNNIDFILWAQNQVPHADISHITALCWKKKIGVEFIDMSCLVKTYEVLCSESRVFNTYIILL